MAITIQETSVLYNNQFRPYRGNFLEPRIYKKHVQKKALEIWKQLGGGDISADFLKAQMNLYKNKKHLFDDEFIASVDTVTNWWMSIDLKNNEEHIKRLAMKLHSIFPHNAACERLFSILGWYFGKRRTRRVHFSLCCIKFKLSLDRLEIMAQMYSYLVENVGSELNYIEQDFRQEDFLAIFNKIASSMEDGSDLFKQMEEDVEELSELDDLVGENSTKLEVENIINLSSKLEINESSAIEKIGEATKMGITPQDICEQVLELAKKGLTPSQLCVFLRNLYNFKPVKDIMVNKIFRILKSYAPEIPEDLYHLIKKAIAV
ncbi:25625_t:CDS:2 [Dentiscutata erythropus]|uniref:25625_t:CDS:1 n=1 Tax=Dentiscutata erythropus TaxID=1348616 RepID=A0A9N8W8N2_9GLOM|nr:25625_t:CDS:2 [Dentiscutata erythropus]